MSKKKPPTDQRSARIPPGQKRPGRERHSPWASPRRRFLVLVAIGALALFALACGSQVVRSGTPPAFDSASAWRYLEAQVAFGPRPPGTAAHTQTKEYLAAELRKSSQDVQLQEWHEPAIGLSLTNLIARFPGKGSGSVMLCAHWDTRPTADKEAAFADRSKPILGANDGASGVAVLLEIARLLKANPPPVTVWLVLFDGEDYGPHADRMYLGAKYFASHLPANVPKKAVLLDMIGDGDLEVPKEANSVNLAPEVINEVWEAARRAGHAQYFPDRIGAAVEDDHLPLLDAGIACIDLIDFRYPYWHTLGDTADKCSPRSLGVIGETMMQWIFTQA